MNRTACKLAVSAFVLSIVGCGERPIPTGANASIERRSKAERAEQRRRVISLTPAAIAKLRGSRHEDGKAYLRVAVVAGGTTGFMYDMKFDNTFDRKNDYLDDVDGIKVVVDKRSALFLEGATIDWQTTPDGRQGFKFDNPNAVK